MKQILNFLLTYIVTLFVVSLIYPAVTIYEAIFSKELYWNERVVNIFRGLLIFAYSAVLFSGGLSGIVIYLVTCFLIGILFHIEFVDDDL